MADDQLLHKIHRLSDLELALLLSLVAGEHCLASTAPDAVDTLAAELRRVAARTFHLVPAVVACHAHMTLDDFAAALMTGPSQHNMANVVIATHLDRAPEAVHAQALELLRTRRVFSRTAAYQPTTTTTTPKRFLFVAVVGASSGGRARLTPHLNDFFYVAHWHDPTDGFPADGPVLTDDELSWLAQRGHQMAIDVDVARYQMNTVAFLRMHRAVAGGISPLATKHLEQLAKSLAALQGLDFVTPAVVRLAVRKVYLHRIRIVAPEDERSMQWGSELQAVEALLDGLGPEEVIEDVLGSLGVPA